MKKDKQFLKFYKKGYMLTHKLYKKFTETISRREINWICHKKNQHAGEDLINVEVEEQAWPRSRKN